MWIDDENEKNGFIVFLICTAVLVPVYKSNFIRDWLLVTLFYLPVSCSIIPFWCVWIYGTAMGMSVAYDYLPFTGICS